MNGKLIVIDGLDGSGKSTQHELAVSALEKENISVKGISFPDYSSPSASLVNMYLKGDFGSSPQSVNAFAASSFYAVDRYASYKTQWEEEYLRGTTILAARYTSSNLFYQMEKLPKEEWDAYIQWTLDYEYNRMGIPEPDKVIFLDMPPAVSRELISNRYAGDESKRDIHEKDFDYLCRCRESALYVSKKLGYTVLPCSQNDAPRPIYEISAQIQTIISEVLNA